MDLLCSSKFLKGCLAPPSIGKARRNAVEGLNQQKTCREQNARLPIFRGLGSRPRIRGRLLAEPGLAADLVIRIPGDLSQQDGYYRLDYLPPEGQPAANTTFSPAAINDVIEFSGGSPGTKYEFKLYYSNSSLADWLAWRASITTAPDPPSNLSIDVISGKVATIAWQPPSKGGYSGFKLKVIPLSEPSKSVRKIVIRENASPFNFEI